MWLWQKEYVGTRMSSVMSIFFPVFVDHVYKTESNSFHQQSGKVLRNSQSLKLIIQP